MNRPVGVTIIAIANLFGALALVASEVLFAEQPPQGGLLGMLVVAMLISVTVTVGLLKLKNWARWIAAVLYVISLVGVPGRMVAAHGLADIISVLLPGLFLLWAIWYLFQAQVKAAFGA
jgi:hypothetical protein